MGKGVAVGVLVLLLVGGMAGYYVHELLAGKSRLEHQRPTRFSRNPVLLLQYQPHLPDLYERRNPHCWSC